MIRGYFKGIYHVYPSWIREGTQDIEEFEFQCFENCFVSEEFEREGLAELLQSVNYKELLLDFSEIIAIKDKEFYFEIVGEVDAEFVTFETPCGTEHDVEIDFPNCSINILEEAVANKFM
jgi:hypothetical protein